MSNSLKIFEKSFNEETLDPNTELTNLLKSGENSEDAIKFLIANGANVNQKAGKQISTLGCALKYKASDNIIKLLIKNGANVNAIHKDGQSVLMLALLYKSSDNIIKLLIEKKADVNAIHNGRGTILMMALLSKASYNIIKLLIKKKVDINRIDNDVQTILMFALEFKASENIIQLLIENEANVNAIVNKNGQTILMFALQFKASENIIQLLINKGADVNAINENDETLLMNALQSQYSYDIIELFIEKGAVINVINSNGQTILMNALEANYSDNIIELLIKKGAHVNVIDKYGKTLLLYAFEFKASENIIELLIKQVTHINAINSNGETILMNALIFKASYYIIQLLIKKGANINAINGYGKTILMIAIMFEVSENIIELIIENGADVNAIDIDIPILTLSLMFTSSDNIVKLIIEKGADVNFIDKNGETLLITALKLRVSQDIIKLFIQNGSDVNAKTIKYAIENKISLKIIQLLTNKTNESSTLQRRSKYDLKYIEKNTLCNTLFEKFKEPLKKKIIFLCNRTNLTEETILNTSETKSKFKELKDEETDYMTSIIMKEDDEELLKINISYSNNIDNYYIRYPGPGIDEGGLKKQFFTIAMEQMFSEYFDHIEGTNRYKLKDTITKEEASKAGFLVAFSLINDMPFTKHINNIYIAKMMYKVRQLSVDDYFLYAILDMNENGRKIFQNTCSDADLLKDYCNPTTYFKEYILSSYGLRNKNLPVFIKSFNLHITKKFLSKNKINIYDISKILTNTKITKADLNTILNTMKLNKINPNEEWSNIYENFRYIMVDLDLSQYKDWLKKYGTVLQKSELSSIHKFHQKVIFFWTSLYSINTNMLPYYSIHYTSTGKHPKAHTCFNQLDIPLYKNSEEMFEYFIQAIISTDFGIA